MERCVQNEFYTKLFLRKQKIWSKQALQGTVAAAAAGGADK